MDERQGVVFDPVLGHLRSSDAALGAGPELVQGPMGPQGPQGPAGSGGSGTGAVDSVNGQTGVVVLNADDIDDTATTNKFVTATDITNLSNLSGTNTGDQDLSSYYHTGGTDVAIADGGTGASTQQAAIDALTGTQTSGTYLRSNGTHAGLSTIQAADVPTLNQNTTGSAATLTTSRNIDGQAFNGSADITVIAPGTHAATSKTTPVDADELPLVDSAASNVLKKLTWANLKATIKSYYDSVTSSLTNKDLTSGTNTFPTFNQNTTGSAAKWTTARNLAGNSVDGSANVAFANKFIAQGTSDAGLSGAQFLGSLSSGIVTVTTTTGVLSSVPAPSGTVVGTSDSQTLTNKTISNPTITGWDGWALDTNTWTRTSNTQFTISSATDFSTQFPAGALLKWKESGTQKYGTVSSSSFASSTTTVNLIANTDYVMAASPDASTTYYSYTACPQGYPQWFNYSTTIVGWASPPTTIARFSTVGKLCTVNIGQAPTATANSTSRTFTNPVAMGGSEPSTGLTWWTCADNGVTLTTGGRIFINAGTPTVMNAGKDMSGAAWTASGASRCNFSMSYAFGT